MPLVVGCLLYGGMLGLRTFPVPYVVGEGSLWEGPHAVPLLREFMVEVNGVWSVQCASWCLLLHNLVLGPKRTAVHKEVLPILGVQPKRIAAGVLRGRPARQ